MDQTEKNTYYQTAESFMNSNEMKELYIDTSSNEEYILSLHENILNKESDSFGFEYWLNQLQSNKDNQNNLLIGFAESTKNKKHLRKKHL